MEQSTPYKKEVEYSALNQNTDFYLNYFPSFFKERHLVGGCVCVCLAHAGARVYVAHACLCVRLNVLAFFMDNDVSPETWCLYEKQTFCFTMQPHARDACGVKGRERPSAHNLINLPRGLHYIFTFTGPSRAVAMALSPS